MAGGTPVVFPAIAVCDGIAMGHIGMKYSLVTRDLIADSTKPAAAHQFDALVMVPNCDKNVPGLLMAAARINVPTVFVSIAPWMVFCADPKTSLSSMFEAVGSYTAGKISEEELEEFECKTCPTCGSCSGMYTNNKHELPDRGTGNGTERKRNHSGSLFRKRIRLAKHVYGSYGNVPKNIQSKDIATEKAILNALTVDMALGCSTNSMLHLPAIAHEIGMVLILPLQTKSAQRLNPVPIAPCRTHLHGEI